MPDSSLQWSQNADDWLARKRAENHQTPVCDVLIIGSGYGGAFAAKELAEAGASVWVMERGREYALGEFPENIGTLPGHVHIHPGNGADAVGNSDALFDLRRFDQVSVLQANGLGGGSLINAGVAIRPDAQTLDGPAWPDHYRKSQQGKDALWKAMGDVEKQLQVKPLTDARALKKFQSLDVLAQSMGQRAFPAPLTIASEDQVSPAGVAQKACTRCGNCFTGCNVGAKNTLVTHVLPDAHRHGAEFITGATALEVLPHTDASAASATGRAPRWKVRMVHTSGQNNPLTRREFEVHAHTVLLCAGALGSTEILLNSTQVATSDKLGTRFSTNGDVLALGWGMRARVNGMGSTEKSSSVLQPVEDRVGPTITGIIKAPIALSATETRTVLIEEGAVPSALNQATVALGATLSLPHRYTGGEGPGYFSDAWGTDRLATPADMSRHAMLMLGMGPDDADGVVSLRTHPEKPHGNRPSLDVRWPKSGAGPDSAYYRALDQWLTDAQARPNGGGFQGGDYLPNPLWRALPPDFNEIAGGDNPPQGVTVHPLGGCPMGNDEVSGVVDWRGTVFKAGGGVHEGLHVLDGAILPGAVGVNPFLTIAALSVVAARDIAQRFSMGPVTALPATPVVSQKQSTAHLPPHTETVKLQFREHLQGFWKGDAPAWLAPIASELSDVEQQRAWIVAVDVELDVAQWVANPSMQLSGARMRVFRNPRPQDITVHPDACSGTPELEGRGWVSLLSLNAPDSRWEQWSRMFSATCTFLKRRNWRELCELATGNSSPWRSLKGFCRAARNISHYRELVYSFDLHKPADDHFKVKAQGRKRLAYAPDAKNVWDALVDIDLTMTPENGAQPATISVTADLIDMVRNHRLQVARAAHTPAGMVAMGAFVALWLRVLFQSHFWSFRGLNYSKLKPPPAAQHGPINGALPPRKVTLPVNRYLEPAGNQETLDLELTCYAPAPKAQPLPASGQHLLMVHGLAHGGTVFTTHTTDGNNMASAFVAQGYTVWVLDHRLSNRLDYHDNDHCMDDVAAIDIPEALRYVYAQAGQPVAVFAHCVGGGAFAMAALKGWLHDPQRGQSMVSKAIIHAVHPWVVPSASNQLSGSLAALYKDFLPHDMAVNPVPPSGKAGALDQVLDRIGASLPWPENELALHNKDRFDPLAGTATCNRMTLFYGREWVHANLNEATHKELASLVGPASVEVFRQLFFIINRQRLTDRNGAAVYMRKENFAQNWTFPILFAHGSENKVFDPRSAVRSWGRLRGVLPRGVVRMFMAPGYGHMDFLFGQNAHKDVYPHLCNFLNAPSAFVSSWDADADGSAIPGQWRDNDLAALRKPLTGPHIRLREAGESDLERRELILWAEFANDPTHPVAAPALCDAQGHPLAGWSATALAHHHLDPENQREITLLDGPGAYWTGRLTEQTPGAFQNMDSLVLKRGPDGLLGEAKLSWAHLFWWQRWIGLAQSRSVSWLAMSCRWPGTPFEGDSIDRMSQTMLSHVTTTQLPAEALLMLGDQIYSDAMANLFETRESDELLAGMYRDAWSGPHTRELLSNVPSYCVVDDHEYGDNWSGAAHPDKDLPFVDGFEAAMAYQWRWSDATPVPWQAQPAIRSNGVTGFWSTFKVGSIPFFAADTRSERTLRTREAWRTQSMISAAQMNDLKDWLQSSGEGPKVLCSGSVFGFVERELLSNNAQTNDRCLASDSWSGYPATWRELVGFIVEHQIRNVIFLSGDYHFSGVAELELQGSGTQPPVRALSVVCSGWNASLPFINAQPSDFLMHTSAAYPLSDATVTALSHAQPLSTAYRQFTKLTLEHDDHRAWQLNLRVYSNEGDALAMKSLPL